jgi:hypothetical protein
MELFTEENTYRGALNFFKRKTIQLNLEGYKLSGIGEFANLGVLGTYQKNNVEFQIFYLYKKLRGNGYYEKIVKKHGWNIIVSDSKYHGYFKNKKINYIPLSGICKTSDYQMACEKLEDSCDSNEIPYILRLDLRLLMLRGLGGSWKTMIAMCQEVYLHLHLEKYGLTGTIKTIKAYREVRRSFYLAEIHQNNEYVTRPYNTEVKKMMGALKIENQIFSEILERGDSSYRSNRWMGILTVSSLFVDDQIKRLEYLKY